MELAPGTLILDFDGCITKSPEKAIVFDNVQLNQQDGFLNLLKSAKQRLWNIFIVSNNENKQLIADVLKMSGYDQYIDGINYGGDIEKTSKIDRIKELVANGFIKNNFLACNDEKIHTNNGPIIFIDDQEENAPEDAAIFNGRKIDFIQADHGVAFLQRAHAKVLNEGYTEHQPFNFFTNHKLSDKIKQLKQQRKDSKESNNSNNSNNSDNSYATLPQ